MRFSTFPSVITKVQSRSRVRWAGTPSVELLGVRAGNGAAVSAYGQDLLGLHYDALSDVLVARIAYRGTTPRHRFTVQWQACTSDSPPHVAGRLVDLQGNEPARKDFVSRVRLQLKRLPCRPAIMTLRLGRLAHATVFVPVR